ncbi:hypothetical protein TIFTF001_031087 [Ficus carica]|uniref:Uncharacterized protein n=1 Tax=Ficus carica TaxID=3494 RepID=A0AA88DUD9_FICCA|nr:hypothetical protein TIFTF001_031087 [Ficus carica]
MPSRLCPQKSRNHPLTSTSTAAHISWLVHGVQSDHYEVVADLVQTSFLFSIPMDGPMSFSTPHVSVQWALRFEFFTTPKNVDWTRYEHPLLIEGRDKSEWVLPITVHAPPPGASAPRTRNAKPFSLEPLWISPCMGAMTMGLPRAATVARSYLHEEIALRQASLLDLSLWGCRGSISMCHIFVARSCRAVAWKLVRSP